MPKSEEPAVQPVASTDAQNPSLESEPSIAHTPRFWIIIVALSLLAFVSALDVTIIPPALPNIVQEIGGSTQYVWIANSFVFASSVLQPLIGQISNILGRKIPVLASILIFIIGSSIAGSAQNAAMLIAGRSVQGVGAGGIYVLIDIVACDLVPLRDRGTYLGIINAWAGVAAGLGPVIGGLLGQSNWRWIFYMNIPICILPLLTVALFMDVKTGDGLRSLRDLDYMGSLIFIPSMIAILWGLVEGGIDYPWSSWQIILPLVLGIVGWISFHLHQHFFSGNPCVPTRLFGNRTSAAGFAMTFLSSVLLQTCGLFLPVYFQAVQVTTVAKSGINFLPTTIGLLFFAAVGGILLTKFGAYRAIHAATFGLSIIGYGLFTLLDESTPKVAWAFFELINAAGLGPTISTILPAILVALPESDVASATAVFSFIKTFGFTWGVTVASIIFNAVFNNNLDTVSSKDLQKQLQNGGGYSLASQASTLAKQITSEVWNEVVEVYVVSLKAVWWFGIAIGAAGLSMVWAQRSLKLSTKLETDYGLNDSTRAPSEHDSHPNITKAETTGL